MKADAGREGRRRERIGCWTLRNCSVGGDIRKGRADKECTH